MATSVYCIAQDDSTALTIVDQLRAAGFGGNDVSVLYPDTSTTKDFAHEMHTKAPEGATTGASSGGILGGALGWLVGIGTLAIPGVGPFIAAGPILAALSGAAIGATAGGVVGGLIGAGIPEVEAKRYEAKLRDGRILISVNATDATQVSSAKQIFKDAGAEDIASASEAKVNQGRTPGASRRAVNPPGRMRPRARAGARHEAVRPRHHRCHRPDRLRRWPGTHAISRPIVDITLRLRQAVRERSDRMPITAQPIGTMARAP